MQQSQRHRRKRRMRNAALSFDQQKCMLLVLLNKFFRGAVDKVSDYAIDRHAFSRDHDARLPGRQKLCVMAGCSETSLNFQTCNHLTDAAVVADSMDSKIARPKHVTFRRRLMAIATHIDQ